MLLAIGFSTFFLAASSAILSRQRSLTFFFGLVGGAGALLAYELPNPELDVAVFKRLIIEASLICLGVSLVLTIGLHVLQRKRFVKFWSYADARHGWVLAAFFIVCYMAGILGTLAKEAGNDDWFWQPFYVSWTVNILFFVVLGSVIAFVSLRNPHDEPFDIRMNILFGKKLNEEPIATQYLQEEIRRLGYITKNFDRSIEINEFDPGLNAYRVTVTTKFFMHNLFENLRVPTELTFGYEPDRLTEEPNCYGRIISFETEKFKNDESINREQIIKNVEIKHDGYTMESR